MTITDPAPIVVLVGLMGTGKSTIARELATRLGRVCFDTDKIVETRSGVSVRQLFADLGESGFRDIETSVLEECLHSDQPCIVAAAGGIVVRPQNRQALDHARQLGQASVVWLHAAPSVLAKRTAKGGHRPLLDTDRLGTLQRLHDERGPLYASVSDVVIDTTDCSIESIVDLIVDSLSGDS